MTAGLGLTVRGKPRKGKARGERHYNYRHGHSDEPLHKRWIGMRNRCRNPKNPRYPLYGGRGITICREWNDYKTFRGWAFESGYQPHLSLDRIDVNGPYAPWNCRWVTQRIQTRNQRRNRRITFKGRTKTLAGWADELGVNYYTLRSRFRLGWSAERAFTTPFRGQAGAGVRA